MPTHDSNASSTINPADLNLSTVECPLPFSRILEPDGNQPIGASGSARDNVIMAPPVSNNTAAGMSMMQEDSMYVDSDPISIGMDVDRNERGVEVREGSGQDDGASLKNNSQIDGQDIMQLAEDCQMPDTPVSLGEYAGLQQIRGIDATISLQQTAIANTQLRTPSPEVSGAKSISEARSAALKRGFCGTTDNPGIPPIDEELNHFSDARPWEFSRKTINAESPSSLFQTCSKYRGTQQSDRQIYNVEVTVLTVNIEQCTMSGYLQICGLTPDHPTLTTFFTGEIIGGPDQKYSFRTNNPAWGASDKTDITHWARFPAWRSLSSHAKKNINFVYPLDQAPWWQQEHIFMRWKEHFLVPDYKLKSIQGASFEGFYYICLNQIEGKISGVYFHSKSEKYQQLELKHDGKQGVWGRGGCGASRPTESSATQNNRTPPPQVRHAPQTITSQTAINPAGQGQPRALEPPSATSLYHSETSRSGLTNSRRSSGHQVGLADHYNLPLELPAPWTSKDRTWTRQQLTRERDEFFETRVTGRREVWDALKQVAECVRDGDRTTAQGILDAAGVTLPTGKLTEGGYDEAGNLYRISPAVLSDPTNVADENDEDDHTMIGTADAKDKQKMLDDEITGQDTASEKQPDKGKASIDKDSVNVKCRLSDRGGPDVIVLMGKEQVVDLLMKRVRDEGDVPDYAKIRVAYLGRILNEKQTLAEQGWKEGHVVQILVSGFAN